MAAPLSSSLRPGPSTEGRPDKGGMDAILTAGALVWMGRWCGWGAGLWVEWSFSGLQWASGVAEEEPGGVYHSGWGPAGNSRWKRLVAQQRKA